LSLSATPEIAKGKFVVGTAAASFPEGVPEAVGVAVAGLAKLSTGGTVNAVGVVTVDAEMVGDRVILDAAAALLSVTGGNRQTLGKNKLLSNVLLEVVVELEEDEVEVVVESAASAHVETPPMTTTSNFTQTVFHTALSQRAVSPEKCLGTVSKSTSSHKRARHTHLRHIANNALEGRRPFCLVAHHELIRNSFCCKMLQTKT
jgi:hypothetical protein